MINFKVEKTLTSQSKQWPFNTVPTSSHAESFDSISFTKCSSCSQLHCCSQNKRKRSASFQKVIRPILRYIEPASERYISSSQQLCHFASFNELIQATKHGSAEILIQPRVRQIVKTRSTIAVTVKSTIQRIIIIRWNHTMDKSISAHWETSHC